MEKYYDYVQEKYVEGDPAAALYGQFLGLEMLKKKVHENAERRKRENAKKAAEDKTKEKYNKLTYSNLSVAFKIEVYDDLSTKAEDWLLDNSKNDDYGYTSNDEYFMLIDTTEEKVHGFDGIKKEGHIYRPGIMLAVFTQLACDYLNEERIKRVY